MQSAQETALESFMERSFGAQHLFVPSKFRKGSAPKEPADLAWVRDDSAVLFYLTRSGRSLDYQIHHNLRQAKGFYRLWSTGEERFSLSGENRFGDSCSLPFSALRQLLTICVVSSHCGVLAIDSDASKLGTIHLAVPEALLYWVAQFGGTIVDLLYLASVFLERIAGERDVTDQDQYELLSALTQAYVRESFQKADPSQQYLFGANSRDYNVMYDILAKMKMPSSSGSAMNTAEGRRKPAELFGDLTLVEYASLAALASRVIDESDPPQFKRWVVAKTLGLHHNFVVASMRLGIPQWRDSFDAALGAAKNSDGETDCAIVIYANAMDANDYRFPLMFTLPNKPPRPQCELLLEKLSLLVRQSKKYTASSLG